MLELYGSLTSPFVRHCRIALLEEKIPFDLHPADYHRSAEMSPTKRVPFLIDGDLMLTDSSVILKYAREKAGKSFLPNLFDANFYFTATTALDTAINLFLLERDGITPDQVPYLQRQQERVASCFQALENDAAPLGAVPTEGQWRLACLLGWVQFRNRFDFSHLPKLSYFATAIEDQHYYAETTPKL